MAQICGNCNAFKAMQDDPQQGRCHAIPPVIIPHPSGAMFGFTPTKGMGWCRMWEPRAGWDERGEAIDRKAPFTIVTNEKDLR